MHDLDTQPWYRQFWPWFIMALPACIVVASIGMLILAIQNPVSLVKDNYYEDGMAINQQLAQEQVVTDMGINAELRLDHLAGEVTVTLSGNDTVSPAQLTLEFIHPTDNVLDRTLSLRSLGDQRFIGVLTESLSGRWYINLAGDQPQPWRMRGEWLLSDDAEAIDQWQFTAPGQGPG